jgi:hypothetical protein
MDVYVFNRSIIAAESHSRNISREHLPMPVFRFWLAKAIYPKFRVLSPLHLLYCRIRSLSFLHMQQLDHPSLEESQAKSQSEAMNTLVFRREELPPTLRGGISLSYRTKNGLSLQFLDLNQGGASVLPEFLKDSTASTREEILTLVRSEWASLTA